MGYPTRSQSQDQTNSDVKPLKSKANAAEEEVQNSFFAFPFWSGSRNGPELRTK